MEPTDLIIWALLEQAKAALQGDENHCPEDARLLIEAASTVLVDRETNDTFDLLERRN